MAKIKGRFGKRRASYQKEAGLLFLAIFYFIIATNTQTGWLFVLSAFLFGVLGISWTLSRRAHQHLEVEQTFLGDPQKGKVFRVSTCLTNKGAKSVQEVKLEFQHPDWAEPESRPFHWAVPLLKGQSAASVEQRLIPMQRGEHTLAPVKLVCGAPFGLFTSTRMCQSQQTFLVYPDIERLPNLKNRSRLATSFGETVSPRSLGDTRDLRSVREYRHGDDQRSVHWKASAKLGGARLMVKEHHAPAPSRVVLVLDTSASGKENICPTFERAVTLTSSLLWAAQREGTRTSLYLFSSEEGWQVFTQWSRQYRALAQVQCEAELSFSAWRESSEAYFLGGQSKDIKGGQVCLLTALSSEPVSEWPTWMKTGYLLVDTNQTQNLPKDSRLHLIEATQPGFQEAALV